MKSPAIPLASPYGVSPHRRNGLLLDWVEPLQGLGLEVREPFARNSQVDLAQEG